MTPFISNMIQYVDVLNRGWGLFRTLIPTLMPQEVNKLYNILSLFCMCNRLWLIVAGFVHSYHFYFADFLIEQSQNENNKTSKIQNAIRNRSHFVIFTQLGPSSQSAQLHSGRAILE